MYSSSIAYSGTASNVCHSYFLHSLDTSTSVCASLCCLLSTIVQEPQRVSNAFDRTARQHFCSLLVVSTTLVLALQASSHLHHLQQQAPLFTESISAGVAAKRHLYSLHKITLFAVFQIGAIQYGFDQDQAAGARCPIRYNRMES